MLITWPWSRSVHLLEVLDLVTHGLVITDNVQSYWFSSLLLHGTIGKLYIPGIHFSPKHMKYKDARFLCSHLQRNILDVFDHPNIFRYNLVSVHTRHSLSLLLAPVHDDLRAVQRNLEQVVQKIWNKNPNWSSEYVEMFYLLHSRFAGQSLSLLHFL